MTSGLRAVSFFAVIASLFLAAAAPAQRPGPVFMPVDDYEGTLRGAVDHHDGEATWVAVLQTKDGGWLICGAAANDAALKKFAGKKVIVRGRAATWIREPSGGVLKLEGKVAGLAYQGNLDVAAMADVTLAAAKPRGLVSDAPLRCRVKKRTFLGARLRGALIEVEVSNKSDRFLEPTLFEVDATPRPEEFVEAARLVRRVDGPHDDRSGRAIPPGGKLSYWLMVGANSEGGAKDKVDVVVREWCEGGESERPDVVIGPPEPSEFEEVTQHPATAFDLENRTDDDLDLFFIATFKRPASVKAVLRISIGAHEHRKTKITHLPAHAFGDQAWNWPGVEVTTLDLVDWSRRPKSAAPSAEVPVVVEDATPPKGAGAAALQAAWQASYSYPSATGTLTGRFAFVAEGARDAVWAGHDRLSGTFRLEGFRGFMNRSPLWRRAQFQIEQAVSEQDRDAVQSALADRFVLWAERDFAGRDTFARRFAGTTIEPKEGRVGSFVISGGTIREVDVRDGRVVALVVDGWPLRRLTWTSEQGHDVATTITTGDETLTARFALVAATNDLLLPVEWRFERVFGPDWGPETFHFTDLDFSPDVR